MQIAENIVNKYSLFGPYAPKLNLTSVKSVYYTTDLNRTCKICVNNGNFSASQVVSPFPTK